MSERTTRTTRANESGGGDLRGEDRLLATCVAVLLVVVLLVTGAVLGTCYAVSKAVPHEPSTR